MTVVERFLATESLLANSYFDEPRLQLPHVPNLTTFGRVELLTISDDDARGLRLQATYPDGVAGVSVVKNPTAALPRALLAHVVAFDGVFSISAVAIERWRGFVASREVAVKKYVITLAILFLAIGPVLRRNRLCFWSSSDSRIRWAFSMI